MQGQRVGYIRVSTYDQNADRQLENITVHRTFMDQASGKDVNRPNLQQMLSFVRMGDTIIVHSMDRLARNLDDLRKIVHSLTKRGVCIEFIKENLQFKSETSPMAQLMLSVVGAFAEFERSLIRERQREGIALAKKKGLYKGRKKSLTESQIQDLITRMTTTLKPNKTQIAKDFGISRETLYQYVKIFENKMNPAKTQGPRIDGDETK